MIPVQPRLISYCIALFICLSTVACTSVKPMPQNAAGLSQVSACNIVEHMKCVYLTGRETISDGLEGQWTRHWFRMSYIGKACERQYGRTAAVILESLFALPHYFFIGLGNSAAAIASPLVNRSASVEVPERKPSERQ